MGKELDEHEYEYGRSMLDGADLSKEKNLVCHTCVSYRRSTRESEDRLKAYELHLRTRHGLVR
jgi:hypothetical protein